MLWNCVPVLMIASAGFGMWTVRSKRWQIRVPVRLICLLLALSGASVAVFVWGFPNPNSYSQPAYSPNRNMAVRVYEYNASGFGGADSSVELFAAHGLKSKVVFRGEYGSVDIANVRWKSDSQLEVLYHGTVLNCAGAFDVGVSCIPH